MRELTHVVAGDTVRIHVVQHLEDATAFIDWVLAHINEVIAFDTETTAGNVFGHGFDVRLAQFGNRDEAWVVPAQMFREYAKEALRLIPRLTVHSFAYDSQVADRTLDTPIEFLTPKVSDTIIMSKLIEPHRPAGHALKVVSRQYVDPDAADTQDGLKERFRELGFDYKRQASHDHGGIDTPSWTSEMGWRRIPIDDELYNRYAGLDVIYGRRLYDALLPLVRQKLLSDLATFEHTIQGYLNLMRRKGILVDLGYSAAARAEFLEESGQWLAIVRDDYGLENINSPKQIAAAFERNGTPLTERNPGKKGEPGSLKTGKEVLLPLAGMDEYWGDIPGAQVNPLAQAIAKGRRAERFANAYLGKFIDLADPAGRIHPDITGLQARTSRMAVSDPPLQQLPAKDWKVRRAILADPGQLILSADYAQIEFRLMASLAGIKKMRYAIENGIDLHAFTAELAYGPDWTTANRTHMKGAGFGVAYGGGAKGLAGKLGLEYARAKNVVDTYSRVYPEIKRWAAKLIREAKANNYTMRSVTGRILTLDRDRTYAAINYQVQSLASDVLKNALEALWRDGLGPHLLMPVHDEVIAQADERDARGVAEAIREAMDTTVLDGMRLEADAEVYGFSWGHGHDYADEATLATPLFTERTA